MIRMVGRVRSSFKKPDGKTYNLSFEKGGGKRQVGRLYGCWRELVGGSALQGDAAHLKGQQNKSRQGTQGPCTRAGLVCQL